MIDGCSKFRIQSAIDEKILELRSMANSVELRRF
jgi:hypothetical protein